MAESLNRTHAEVRILTRGLLPVNLSEGGLATVLKEFCDRVADQTKLKCVFTSHGAANVEDTLVATHLFRIAQEAVNNVVKHARARHVGIELAEDSGNIVLRVSDDRDGLRRDRPERDGSRLRIMRYRAGAIGGNLVVHPRDGGGTVVTCTILKDPSHGTSND